MSAAGLARVKVTQRKLLRDQEAKLESSVMTSSGGESVVRNELQKLRTSGESDFRFWILDFGFSRAGGPSTATIPGRTRRGFLKSAGRERSAGSSVANLRMGGPAAAMTTLEPALRAWPE